MIKGIKQARLLAVVMAFATFFAAVSVAYGGLNWTGIDPVLKLSDGTIVNVDIGVPPGQWCKINGPIAVDIAAPVDTMLVKEQSGPCGVSTVTSLTTGDDGEISVMAHPMTTNGKAKFKVQVMISSGGQELATCSGKANGGVSCDADLD